MSSNEELYKQKLLNNEFLEENIGWTKNDKYYCENQDNDLIQFLKHYMDSDFSIKNVVFQFYQILKNRYHNNFYLEFIPSQDELNFILRGQPIFDSNTINLIVKYTITIKFDDCYLTTDFIIPKDSEYEYEKNYINNYQETTGNYNIVDNSDNIKNLLDSISLRNYVNKINEHNSSTKEDKNTVQTKPEPSEKTQEESKTETTENIKPVEKTPITNESVIYCPNCGEANYSLNRECTKCKSTLISYMTDYGNEITSYDEILSKEAIKRIEKAKITPEFYDNILKTISGKCSKIDFSDDVNVYDKIVHITRKFVDVMFEYHNDPNMYGIYRFDLIHINSNKSFSQQCASLIRYLSVEIHLEIMEAIFMYIFDVKNNAFVRNFIDSCRDININEELIHMYYPIQVEAHFIPPEYHSYDRINEIMEYIQYKKIMEPEQFRAHLIIGNSFAQDIIKILDNVIGENMKKQLAKEYEFDKEIPVKGSANFSVDETLKFNDVIKAMKMNMIETIKFINENENIRKKLYDLHKRFEGKGSSI